jgi:hypothetical protein
MCPSLVARRSGLRHACESQSRALVYHGLHVVMLGAVVTTLCAWVPQGWFVPYLIVRRDHTVVVTPFDACTYGCRRMRFLA